jgi:hypothetical protein
MAPRPVSGIVIRIAHPAGSAVSCRTSLPGPAGRSGGLSQGVVVTEARAVQASRIAQRARIDGALTDA